MKKKAISYILILSLIFVAMAHPVCAIAASDVIVVEGEEFYSCDFKGSEVYEDTFSAAVAYNISTRPDENYDYYVTYKFNVPQEGEYTFSGITTALTNVGSGYEWTTDYTLFLNDEYIFDETNVSDIGAVSTSYYSKLVRNYDFGKVYLEAGVNEIKVVLDKYDLNLTNGKIEFLIDLFSFTPTKSEISVLNEIKSTEDMGIYSSNDIVTVKYVFSIPTNEIKEYIFEVSDVWGKKIKLDKVTIPKGVRNYVLNVGTLPCGWYNIKTYTLTEDANVKHTFISVIQPQTISDEDNIFAMDFASVQLVSRNSDAVMYAEALKKAGIDWIRERYGISADYSPRISRFEALKSEDMNILSMNGMPGSDITGDLFTVKDNYAEATKFMGEYAKVMEVGNETDLSSAMISTPDTYAAFFKAAAIGIADTNPEIIKSMAGLAFQDGHATEAGVRYLENDGRKYYVNNITNYTDLLMQNDILSYSDIFNYHYHQGANTNDVVDFFNFPLTEGNIISYSYNSEKPVWVSEAGETTRSYTNDEYAPFEDYVNQARYLVTSYIQSFAKGTDKHFWFVFPYYLENNGEFGVFDKNMTPYPAYSALATTTRLLKNTKYKGKLNYPTPGVEGHIFTDGTKDTVVVWATSPSKLQLTSESALVHDFMGYSTDKVCCAKTAVCPGKVVVNISHFPLFIELPGEIAENEYYPMNVEINYPQSETFTDSQKLILQPLWQGETSLSDARMQGYSLKIGDSEQLKIKLYNMSDKTFSGLLNADISDTLIIDTETAPFTVESGETAEFIFNVSAGANAVNKEKAYVKISGETDTGEKISPSVIKIKLSNPQHVEDNIELFSGFSDESKWDFANKQSTITDNVTFDTADNSLTFSVAGGGWYYPDFYPTAEDIEKFSDAAGICMLIDCSESASNCGNNVFAVTNDGRKYFIGDSNRIYFEKGSKQVSIKWSDFILFSSPLGNVDFRALDPKDIKSFQIGINFSSYCPEYTVKDFALFYSEDGTNGLEHCISIDGVIDFGTYKKGEVHIFNAYLPDDEYNNIYVLNRQERFDDFMVTENKVTVDLSKLDRGFYSFIVCAENKVGYINRAVINFYIK